jgi:hypothetical protein
MLGESAIVAVDTEARITNAGFLEISKLCPIVHSNLVLAGRGPTDMLALAWQHAQFVPNIEALEVAMPEILDRAHIQYVTQGKAIGFSDEDIAQGFELTMVGWSEARGRMVGTRYAKKPGESFAPNPIDSANVAPGEGVCWPPGGLRTVAQMESIAHEQVRYMRAAQPDVGIGGKLIVVELSRHGMRISYRKLAPARVDPGTVIRLVRSDGY